MQIYKQEVAAALPVSLTPCPPVLNPSPHPHPLPQAEFSNPNSVVLVYEQRECGPVVGFVVAWQVAGEVQVCEVAVLPSAQRRGAGRALMMAMLQQCR